MALNWASECQKSTIKCSSVASDTYEVANLISNDPTRKIRGFRAEYFVRPPIEIIVTFPFPIDLCTVVVGLTVGTNQANSLELHVKTMASEERIFLAKVRTDKTSVVFKNNRYFANKCMKLADVKLPDLEHCSSSEHIYISRNNMPSCTRVTEIIIRVTGTKASSIPCLGSLATYGQPSLNRDNFNFVKDAINLCRSQQVSCSTAPKISLYGSSLNEESDQSLPFKRARLVEKEVKENGLEVPAEYCDPLTTEIMCLPMTLPSGNTVDSSTLEKYNQSEAVWNRNPNDPFTGKFFTRDSQPLPNAALKSRIDQFLTLNHEKLSRDNVPVKRTVGGEASSGKASRLVEKVASNFDLIKERKSSDLDCVACNQVHDRSEIMYKLPCRHLICRSKWTFFGSASVVKEFACLRCRLPVDGTQIVRFHF